MGTGLRPQTITISRNRRRGIRRPSTGAAAAVRRWYAWRVGRLMKRAVASQTAIVLAFVWTLASSALAQTPPPDPPAEASAPAAESVPQQPPPAPPVAPPRVRLYGD